jgi:hypothetical protein
MGVRCDFVLFCRDEASSYFTVREAAASMLQEALDLRARHSDSSSSRRQQQQQQQSAAMLYNVHARPTNLDLLVYVHIPKVHFL